MTIFEAIRHKSIKQVKEAVKTGADINERPGSEKISPLMEAADGGNVEIIRFLLEKGADGGLRDRYGRTALFYVNSLESLVILLENRLDPDAKDDKNLTILMKIIDNENFDKRAQAVKLLIEKGVSINEKNENGWTALAFASKNNLLDIAETLIKNGADATVNGTFYGDEGSITGNIAFLYTIYNRNDEMQKLLAGHGAK